MDFKDKLFNEQPPQDKILRFKRFGNRGNYYQLKLRKKSMFDPPDEPDFKEFMRVMLLLSTDYLDWLRRWIGKVERLSFSTNFAKTARKNKLGKKIKRATVALDNVFLGLPIFKEGDSVIFSTSDGELESKATVIQIEDRLMTVIFPKPIKRRWLLSLTEFRPDNQASHHKIKCWQEKLEIFNLLMDESNEMNRTYFRQNSPAEVLTGKENINRNSKRLKEVFLSPAGERMLRDHSQTQAFANILGNSFLDIVIGPAGTGKTFLTSLLVAQLLKAVETGRVILVASHSNLGVDNLVLEIAKHVDPKKIFRLGRDVEVISPPARPFHCSVRAESGFFGRHSQKTYTPAEAEAEYLRELLSSGGQCVLACTLDSFLSLFRERDLEIHTAFIDEASRGLPFEFLPVVIAAQQKVVFIGDNRQLGNISLPPEVLEFLQAQAAKQGLQWPAVELFNRGFFNALVERGYFPVNLLNHNRRSLNLISRLVSQVFYSGQLIPSRFNPYSQGELCFFDSRDNAARFKEERSGTSFCNRREADYLIKLFIARATRQIAKGGKITDLAVITPYSAQVKLLKKRLRKHLLFHTGLNQQVTPENIDDILEQLVITVDAILGSQRQIIFISLVRSNSRGDIGFNSDIRRINVALSRAQDTLIIVGNSAPFLECDYPEIKTCFQKIIKFIKSYGAYKKL